MPGTPAHTKSTQFWIRMNSQNLVLQLSHKDNNSKWPSTLGTRALWQALNHQEQQNLLNKRHHFLLHAHTHVQVALSGVVKSSPSLRKSVSTWRSTDIWIGKNCMILPKAKLISNLFNELGKLYVCENCQPGLAVSSLRYPDPWRSTNSSTVPAEVKWA